VEEQELPKVTIIVPTRNEVHFIEKCLNSFIVSDYPEHLMEIIIVDGVSEDGTGEIVKRYCERDRRIILIKNQKLITPVALNLGVKASKGEYILFSSAHSEMPSDYISRCIKHAIETGADNVGGVMKTEPRVESAVGIAISKVLSSPFGVGGAKFRTGVSRPTEVDTVPFGCYKREVFDKVGYFNERLVRNQDIEFNLRLKRAGGKIILFPDIELTYYARSTYKELWSNNYGNGFWVITGAKFAKIPFSLRHLVPLIFVLSLVLGAALSFVSVLIETFSLLMILMYLVTVIWYSISICMATGKWKSFFASVLAFPILHVSYGVGSLVGLFSLIGRGEQN